MSPPRQASYCNAHTLTYSAGTAEICSADATEVLLSGASGSMRSPRGYASPRQASEQISDLKLELARRDAEVQYLEAQLAEAVAANRPLVRSHDDRSPDRVSLCQM